MWDRGSQFVENLHMGEEARHRYPAAIPLAVVSFVVIIVFGVIVLLLVSSAHFDQNPSRVPYTSGPCYPFCTNTAPPTP
ncbi:MULTISPECIES: hypothetical protein [unclassified Nocardia]|uniref:hypothetical protein n=1 Tax=unclassified Nocardia TaxID=2637762 RepID=UPI001CE3CFD2|nr:MULTISPECIES: hypothetical protein [unclassified Nocardia]